MKRIEGSLVASVLAHLSQGVSIKQACLAVGVSHDTIQRWRKRSPENASIYNDAMAAGRQAVRLALLTTIDSPLPASTRAARRAANKAAWQVERRLLHTYGEGRPKRGTSA